MAKKIFYSIVEFEDGLQLIPNNWLREDLSKAFWPNFTNNKRYDKAVKMMEEPECTWSEHPVRKIYGTFCIFIFLKFVFIIIYHVDICKCINIFVNCIR